MALRYYDDIVAAKIKYWMPDNNALRVLKPDETKRLFETYADDKQDKPIQLPLIALSRSPDLELLLNIKNPRSFDGLKLEQSKAGTRQLNVIPVKLLYQMDIYTKTFEEADEYLRQYLFKLINNPKIHIDIPYNNTTYSHVAYIRVLSNIADTSNISERLFGVAICCCSDRFFFNCSNVSFFPPRINSMSLVGVTSRLKVCVWF